VAAARPVRKGKVISLALNFDQHGPQGAKSKFPSYDNFMWNGYDCREVTSAGAQKCGIEKTKAKMVGRGVFRDVRKHLESLTFEPIGGVAAEVRAHTFARRSRSGPSSSGRPARSSNNLSTPRFEV
jgi:hypothetical protein